MKKVIMAGFYKIDFTKGIILVKVDQMYNILKSANHFLLIQRGRRNSIIKALAVVCPWMSIGILHPSFIKGLAKIVGDTAVEKESDIAK